MTYGCGCLMSGMRRAWSPTQCVPTSFSWLGFIRAAQREHGGGPLDRTPSVYPREQLPVKKARYAAGAERGYLVKGTLFRSVPEPGIIGEPSDAPQHQLKEAPFARNPGGVTSRT